MNKPLFFVLLPPGGVFTWRHQSKVGDSWQTPTILYRPIKNNLENRCSIQALLREMTASARKQHETGLLKRILEENSNA